MNTLNSSSSRTVNNNDGNGNRDYSGTDRSNIVSHTHDHDGLNRTNSKTPGAVVGMTESGSTTTQGEEYQVQSPVLTGKRVDHHFYYVPSSQDDTHVSNEVRSFSIDDGSRDERFHSNDDQLRLHDSIFPRDQPQLSSPMVTPPSRNDFNAVLESSSLFKEQESKVNNGKKKLSQSSINHPVAGVPHIYHDYSQSSYDETTFTRKKTGGVSQPFPEKLHEMLSTVDGTNEMNIVAWLPHGRAFIVRKPKEFTDLIMPK
jgi:HSF-type DNA-binding